MPKPYAPTPEPATRLILQGDDRVRTAASAAWGVDFSRQACRAVERDGRATLWLGPDEFMLHDARPLQSAWIDALADAIGGLPHALVDISERQVGLTMTGAGAATLLSGACPLDLDLGAFPVHMCTRTVFGKADILIWRTARETFHLEVWRSFVPYVSALLDEIAAGYPSAP